MTQLLELARNVLGAPVTFCLAAWLLGLALIIGSLGLAALAATFRAPWPTYIGTLHARRALVGGRS